MKHVSLRTIIAFAAVIGSAHAAPTFVGTPSNPSYVDNTNVNASLGGTSQTNDLAVAWYGCFAATSCTISSLPLTNYTNANNRTGSQQKIYVDWKLASGAESNPTVTRSTGSAGDNFWAAGMILRGVDTTTPIAHSTTNASTTTSTTVPAPALTITTANTKVCLFVNVWGTGAITWGSYNPNGTGNWTLVANAQSTALSQDGSTAVYCTDQTTATNITAANIAVTGSGTYNARMVMVAFASGTSAPTYTVDPTFGSRTTSTTTVTATITDGGATTTRYGVLVADGSGAPTCTQIKAGQNSGGSAAVYAASATITTSIQHTLTYSSMTDGSTLDEYECANNSAGDTAVESLADQYKTPVLTSATLNSATTNSVTLRCNGDTPNATCYCVVYTDGGSTPTATQIAAGQDSSGATAYKSGSVSMANASTNYDITLTGYTSGTKRDGACVIKNTPGTYGSAVTVADIFKKAAWTANPTKNSSTTDGFVIGETLDGAGEVDVVVCKSGSTAPNATEVDAETCAGGATALAHTHEDVIGADTQTLSGMDFPKGDIYVIGKYAGGTTSDVYSLTAQFKLAPTGYQYQALSSVSSTSPLAVISSPAVAANDVWELYAVTNPDSFSVLADSAGDLSYSGTTARQLICYRVYDNSAMDWMSISNPSASCAGTRAALWFNNQVPAFSPPSTSLVVRVGSAMSALDLCALATDAEGDALTGIVASGSLPTGLSLGGTGNCTLSGTPTVEDEDGVAAVFRVTDITGATGDLNLTIYPIDTIAVPDCTHLSLSACESLLDNKYLTSNIAAAECDLGRNAGDVISQSPAPSSEADPFTTVDLTVVQHDTCGMDDQTSYIRYFGSATSDNEVLFTTASLGQYDACTLMSTTGSADIYVSLDGASYAIAPLSLQDMGATNTNPVLSTVTLRAYKFEGKFPFVKARQNGATGAAVSMVCWKL